MHKTSICIIILLTFFTFYNALLNGFVGDDDYCFVTNSFYRSLANFPRLFSKDYITDNEKFYGEGVQDRHSGFTSYRPVVSATYFFDYARWGLNPYGYHLGNIVLHAVNSILVYILISVIVNNNALALFSTIVFAVHPMRSEAVCSITYRSEPLACFFVLLSVITFIFYSVGKYKTFLTAKNSFPTQQRRYDDRREEFSCRPDPNNFKKSILLISSYLFSFLGMFTKETAIVGPILIMAYDFYFHRRVGQEGNPKKSILYFGYIVIILFYLYIYRWVFPSSILDDLRLLGDGIISHTMISFKILLYYLDQFFLPWTVKILPPYYVPAIESSCNIVSFLGFAVLIVIFYFIIWGYNNFKSLSFFLLWFLVAYIPVSNLFPLLKPMAYRYMYSPSIGLSVIFAMMIERISSGIGLFPKQPYLGKILRLGFIGVCVLVTIYLNGFWKNNYTMARAMISNFPNNPLGYFFIGQEYFKQGACPEAKEAINKSIELGLIKPLSFFLLGVCSQEKPTDAIAYFEEAIKIDPQYAFPDIGLGRIYLLNGDVSKSLFFLKKGVELAPTFTGFGYLIQDYLLQNQVDQAKDVLRQARKVLNDQDHLRTLANLIDSYGQIKLPLDLGI